MDGQSDKQTDRDTDRQPDRIAKSDAQGEGCVLPLPPNATQASKQARIAKWKIVRQC